MKRTTVLALALALAGFGHAPVAVASPVPGPDGQKCFLLSATDLNLEAPPDWQLGVLVAGPLEATGTLTCTIQAGGPTHASVDTVRFHATGGPVPGRIFDYELVSYPAPPAQDVYVCAQYTEGSSTIYWTGDAWDDDVNSPCQQTLFVGTEDPLAKEVMDTATGLAGPLVVCPVLQALSPFFSDPNGVLYVHPSGDAFLLWLSIWDCAPLDQRTELQQLKVVVGPLP